MNVLAHAVVFIPAFRKNARFQDDLLRKLSGVSLVQRAIDKARLLGCREGSIHLLTDSEEIALISERNKVNVFIDSTLGLKDVGIDSEFRKYLLTAECGTSISVLLSAYAPLLSVETVQDALRTFAQTTSQVLQPVRLGKRRIFDSERCTLANNILGDREETHAIESRAFTLLRNGLLLEPRDTPLSVHLWNAGEDTYEIETLQDWWVSEKLLRRKRIVFRVIGDSKVGMGHVYRALALAHDLHDHEILFVTDERNKVAVEAIVKRDFWLGVYAPEAVITEIIRLRPDMLINDVLDTKKIEIQEVKDTGSVVVSFEDLGSGARVTDLTINEIYDKPKFKADHIKWGQQYFFLRDEFQSARPNRFRKKVTSVMLAFGGTDQHDLAYNIFTAIRTLCEELGIFVHIVTGPGYQGYARLSRRVEDNDRVLVTHGSEVISGIMEQVEVAITSNGRTVYEFAHMNIPAIVIAQHEREVTHSFATEDNGFNPLGIYIAGETEQQVIEKLRCLVLDTMYRRRLYKRMTSCRFTKNKEIVVNLIRRMLDEDFRSPKQ